MKGLFRLWEMGNGGRAILFLMGVVIQKYMYRGSGCLLMEERPKGRCFSPPQHASTRSTIYRDKCSLGHSALSHSSQQFGSACYPCSEDRGFTSCSRHARFLVPCDTCLLGWLAHHTTSTAPHPTSTTTSASCMRALREH